MIRTQDYSIVIFNDFFLNLKCNDTLEDVQDVLLFHLNIQNQIVVGSYVVVVSFTL